MSQTTYMDYAAATPVDERVVQMMNQYLSDNFYNPSSVYLASRAVKSDINDAKAEIAHWLGARPSEIIVTAGATEADNLAVRGVLDAFGQDGEVVYSSIEHDAIAEPANKYKSSAVSVDGCGMLNLDELRQAISPNTGLVSVIYANNEIGTVQHISDIANVIKLERERRLEAGEPRPIYLHTDASQASNYLDLHVDKLSVDLMTISGGKIYGPKQVGALYVRAGIVLTPLILGGGQERGLRSGTENVAGTVGLAKALTITQKKRKDEVYRLTNLTNHLKHELQNSIDNIEFLGHKKHRLPNIVSVLVHGVDGERVAMMLDEVGIQAATGSACSALQGESSHVVKALGRSDEEARSTLRFSLGRPTTDIDVEKLIKTLPNIVGQARKLN